MPARQFALHIEAQRVAGIQKLWVGRVVTQANGVHIHRLDEQHVLDILSLGECTPSLWTERMTVHTLYDDFLPIDEETVFFVAGILMTIFDGAETKLLAFHMESVGLSA